LNRFRWLAVVGATLGLAVALWVERKGVADYPWRLSWQAFVVAVALFALAPFVGATSFWLLLRGVSTEQPSFWTTRVVWMRSFIARYVPSGALTVAVRLRSCAMLGVSRREMLKATALEQVVAAAGGATVILVAFVLRGRHPPLLAAVILAAGAALALTVRAVRGLRWRLLAVTALNAAGWVMNGVAAWLLTRALVPSAPGPLFVIAAYTLAWLVGFVIVFAPSGLGAREATLIAALSPDLGVAAAAVVAVALRFANIVGDLLALSAVEGAAYVRRVLRAPSLPRPPSRGWSL